LGAQLVTEEPVLIRIVIPGEPKGVARGRSVGVVNKATGKASARVYTPAATRTEAGVIRMYAEQAMAGRPPLPGPIDLRIAFYKAIPASMPKKYRVDALTGILLPLTKPDFDNTAKFVDQFKGIVWHDDAHVTDHVSGKRFSERPMTVFEIRTMPGFRGWPIGKAK